MSESLYEHEQNGPEYVCVDRMTKLRACFVCHLVKTEKQFRDQGCDNCLFFKKTGFEFPSYTTPHFESLVSVIDPRTSWVAKHLGIDGYVAGTYCRRTKDEPSKDTLEAIRSNNIPMAFNPK